MAIGQHANYSCESSPKLNLTKKKKNICKSPETSPKNGFYGLVESSKLALSDLSGGTTHTQDVLHCNNEGGFSIISDFGDL